MSSATTDRNTRTEGCLDHRCHTQRNIPGPYARDIRDVSCNGMLAAGMRSWHRGRLAVVRHLLAAALLLSCHLPVRHYADHDRHRDDSND
jgi:hypothetical protein